jgi:4-carboxymuconolactone decarboxylase
MTEQDIIMPRVNPITAKSDLPAEHHAVADAVLKVFGHIRGPFSVLLQSPTLAERLLPMVTFVREDTIVEPRLRFVAILTAARERSAAYVWAAQVAQARTNGIREELIDVIRANGDPRQLPADERDVLVFIRQLMRENRVDPAIFDALKSRHSAQWLVELTAIANFFAFVSGICNAFEVTPPPNADKLPA